MAKGGGGEGHFDERRRAKAAATGYADSPEVLSAIVKPRNKPVVKKKKAMAVPRAKPEDDRVTAIPISAVSRVPKPRKTLSDWGRRLGVGQLDRASAVAVKSRPSAPPIGLGARTAERRMREPVYPTSTPTRGGLGGKPIYSEQIPDRGPGAEIPKTHPNSFTPLSDFLRVRKIRH